MCLSRPHGFSPRDSPTANRRPSDSLKEVASSEDTRTSVSIFFVPVGEKVPVLISLFANKMLGCLEFICEESHRNLAVTPEQRNSFQVIRMESYNSNLLISFIHSRDLRSLQAEPSFCLLGRNNIKLHQRNLDHLSTRDLEAVRIPTSA